MKPHRIMIGVVFVCLGVVKISALTCNVCHGATKLSDCFRTEVCQDGQVCENTYRYANGGRLMSKGCKQKTACYTEVKKNADNNCKRHNGKDEVCRCCCETDKCNSLEKGCVSPNQCEMPSKPKSGTVRCPEGRLTLGQKCKYACSKGFELFGPSSVRCEKSKATGKLHRQPTAIPVCERTCPIIGSLDNGHVDCTNPARHQARPQFKYVGTKCNFRCNLNYAVQGARNTKCLVSGRWSNPLPTCIRTQCTEIKPDENRIDDCTDENFADSNCRFKCRPGYQPIGETETTCRQIPFGAVKGKWSYQPPICEPIPCPVPEVDKDKVQQVCETKDGVDNAVPMGGTCSYTCAREGFYMKDSEDEVVPNKTLTLHCKGNATWSFPAPDCLMKTCHPITPPRFGNLPECSREFDFKTVCMFSCKDGYRLSHETNASCIGTDFATRFGIWSIPAPPECYPNECEDFGPVKYGKITYSDGNKIGSVGELTCNDGFTHRKYESINCLGADDPRIDPDWDHKKYVCCVRCSFNNQIALAWIAEAGLQERAEEWSKFVDFTEIVLNNLNNHGFNIKFALVLYGDKDDGIDNLTMTRIMKFEDVDEIAYGMQDKIFGIHAATGLQAIDYTSRLLLAERVAEKYVTWAMPNTPVKGSDDALLKLRLDNMNVFTASFDDDFDTNKGVALTGDIANVFIINSYRAIETVHERIAAISKDKGCSRASKTSSCPR